MGSSNYGGVQITTVLHLKVLFMGRLERFWRMWKDVTEVDYE
jgi:hypothetical protein